MMRLRTCIFTSILRYVRYFMQWTGAVGVDLRKLLRRVVNLLGAFRVVGVKVKRTGFRKNLVGD